MEKNEILEYLQRIETRQKKIESFLSLQKNVLNNVLNLDEVCTLTGLSKSHIYKCTMAGTIPHFKQSKHLFFDRVEIENWLKSNRIKTKEEIEKEAISYVTLNKKGGVK